MGFYALTGLINAIASTLLGVFVYLRNRKQINNQLFFLFCLSMAIWSYAYFFWQTSSIEFFALFWCRALMVGAIFIPIFYLHFVLGWIRKIKEKKNYLIFGYLIFSFFFFSNFTSLFVKSVSPKFNFLFWPNPGILFHFFLVLWVFCVIYTIYLLIEALSTSTGVFRSQLRYILAGVIIGTGGGVTNYFLWYDISIPPIGNGTATLYILLVAYAIVKYRFMDIRVVVGKGAVYVFSFGTVIVLASGMIFLNNKLALPVSANIAYIVILVVSILLFQPVFRFFEKIASKYFYYSFYSSQKVITNLGKKLTEVLELDKLTSLIADTLMDTMKLDKAGVLLRDSETRIYQIQKIIGFREENGISLVRDNFLTLYLERNKKSLVYEELGLAIRDAKTKKEKENLKNLQANMKRIEASLCLPLFRKNEIIGMIILGSKISQEPFSIQDIELLNNLSSQASLAIQNAVLYSKEKDFGIRMDKEVKKATKDLADAYKKLEKLDKAKSEFIAITSHQLRTPLTIIKGYLSMALDGTYGGVSKKLQRVMKNIYESNERLIRLVNSLLNISRIETGKIALNIEKISLEKLISDIVSELKIEAKNKKIYLRFQKPKTSLSKISIDKDKMRQCIVNLIDNAIKYTEKGGVVIKLIKEKTKIKIIVSDTGHGIAKEEISRLFESFSRGKAGNKLYTEGAGIGLYVAKSFVKMHKGKIYAKSEGKDKGSAFYIELPIR
ncbi:MAG: ATP-binding protein [Patescibacteria group bacterium]|nr:ATP-binding protein [Patescibacteria group bacterium]